MSGGAGGPHQETHRVELTTPAAVAAHDAVPCHRSRCEVCAAACGKEDVHTRSANVDVEMGLPMLPLDYGFLRAQRLS